MLHCHSIDTPLQTTSIQKVQHMETVGVFSLICLNGLYFWSAKFENFFSLIGCFFFFSFQYQLQNCKTESHVKILTPTFNDFRFHSNSLDHLTSSLLGYCSSIHMSTFYQCSMALNGITPRSHTYRNATTIFIILNGLYFFSSRRSKETSK